MKLLFQCVVANLFGAVGAFAAIDHLLQEIVKGNLGIKAGQKFIYSLPIPRRWRSGALRVKVTRYLREFDLYAAVRRGVMILLALVQVVQMLLIFLGQEKAAEWLNLVSFGAFLIPTGALSLHAREWQHRTKYTRDKP